MPLAEHHFALPKRLTELLDTGVWPVSAKFGTAHRSGFRLGSESARAISTDDDQIALMLPPFHTIADEVHDGNRFWTEHLSNVGEIDYRKALIIADFGPGSDSVIVLYYGHEAVPSVKYLKWSGNGQDIVHQWVRTHPSFDQFAAAVGLR